MEWVRIQGGKVFVWLGHGKLGLGFDDGLAG